MTALGVVVVVSMRIGEVLSEGTMKPEPRFHRAECVFGVSPSLSTCGLISVCRKPVGFRSAWFTPRGCAYPGLALTRPTRPHTRPVTASSSAHGHQGPRTDILFIARWTRPAHPFVDEPTTGPSHAALAFAHAV